MKEYIVIKDILNIRTSPSDESEENFAGQILGGDSVWLEEKEIIGTVPKGGSSNVWLARDGSTMVARDGVMLKSYEDRKSVFLADESLSWLHGNNSDENLWKISWGQMYLEVHKIWNHPKFPSKGEGVNIGIIDTGIMADNADLTSAVSKCYYAPKDGGDIDDKIGHGTKAAGLIAATGESLFYGVAPRSKLFVAKKNDKEGAAETEYFERAFEWILETDKHEKIDVLSLCFNCEKTEVLSKAVDECINRNIIIVCAAGNAGKFQTDLFPSGVEKVLSVAFLSMEIERHTKSSYNPFTRFILPGENLLTTSISLSDRLFSFSSAATPLLAGILALFISLRKNHLKEFSNETLIKTLFDTGVTIHDQVDREFKWKLPQLISTLDNL